jgi:hypothetical protein
MSYPQSPSAKYRELRSLEPDALIPELQKIVIDYAVDIPDYGQLKHAFMSYLVRTLSGETIVQWQDVLHSKETIAQWALRGDDGTIAIAQWRGAILQRNRLHQKNKDI